MPPGLRHTYLHTPIPTEADFHLIYGLRAPLRVPNTRDRIAFVASEPPEIREYSLTVLKTYGQVFAPEFPYLASLHNYQRLAPVAPWWVGTGAGGVDHYSSSSSSVSLLRTDFKDLAPPERDILSVIVSSKARTPFQIQRVKLADYLHSKMNEVEIWGEGRRFVEDKALVLRTSRYHLAIENSAHRGYWTEKLADPVLLSNYVFYQGAPDIDSVMDTASICAIDSFDLEGTYRKISEAMSHGAWSSSSGARINNLSTLLDRENFHQAIDGLLKGEAFDETPRITVSTFPAHHPTPRWKKLVDPIYRVLKTAKR